MKFTFSMGGVTYRYCEHAGCGVFLGINYNRSKCNEHRAIPVKVAA
jgi:hypothetical protein